MKVAVYKKLLQKTKTRKIKTLLGSINQSQVSNYTSRKGGTK